MAEEIEDDLPILKKTKQGIYEKTYSTGEELPVLKKKVDTFTQKMDTGVSESEFQPSAKSVSEVPFTAKVKEHNLAKDKIVKNKLRQVLTENDNPIYHNKFIETLAKKGYDINELNQEKANVLQGKKLIQENTPKAYEPAGVPRDEVKRNYDLGSGYLMTGKDNEAIEAFTKSLSQLPPEKVQTTKKIFVQPGNDASIYSEQATKIEADKNPASQLYGIGLAYLNKKDDTNAANFFLQALKQDPSNANAMLGLANVAENQGNKDESKKLITQAAGEYKREGLAVQYESELSADKEKQRQANEMLNIANGLEAFIVGDPDNKLGVLGKMTPWGFVYHNAAEMGEGVVVGLETMAEGAKKVFREEMGRGLLEVGVGAGRAIFSAIPAIAVFNSAIQPINEAAQANPENKTLGILAAIPEKIFAPATAIAELVGEKPKEGATGALALEAADLISVLAGGALLHKKAGDIKDAKGAIAELQDLSKKSQEAGKQEQSKKEAQAFADAINQITASEFKKEAEKQGKVNLAKAIDEKLNQVRSKRKELGVIDPTYVDDMPLSVVTTFDRIDKKIPIDPVLLDEASKYLYDKYKKLDSEKENPNRIQSVGDISAIQEQLGKDIAIIEDYKTFQRDVETPLSEWKKQAEELKSELENDKIKDKAPIQVKLDELNNKIEASEQEQRVVEIDQKKAELEAIDAESKIAGLEEDFKNAKTESAKEVIKEEIDKLTPKEAVVAKPAEVVAKPSKREIAKTRLEQRKGLRKDLDALPDLTDKSRADVKALEEGGEIPESDFDNYIADNSGSPLELAENFLRLDVESETRGTKLSAKGNAIENSFIKIIPEQWEYYAGENAKKELVNAQKKYISENGLTIDQAIEKINSEYPGINVTRDDIIEHIRRVGYESTLPPKTLSVINKFKAKFSELTNGGNLTRLEAKRLVENNIKEKLKNYEKIIDREFKTATEAEAAYREAFETGDLAIEGGEVITTPESYARPTKIKASEDIKSKFAEAMEVEKAIKAETDRGKLRELKRKNAELRKAYPGLAETMNKFASITNKLAELKTKEGESLIKKSEGCP